MGNQPSNGEQGQPQKTPSEAKRVIQTGPIHPDNTSELWTPPHLERQVGENDQTSEKTMKRAVVPAEPGRVIGVGDGSNENDATVVGMPSPINSEPSAIPPVPIVKHPGNTAFNKGTSLEQLEEQAKQSNQ